MITFPGLGMLLRTSYKNTRIITFAVYKEFPVTHLVQRFILFSQYSISYFRSLRQLTSNNFPFPSFIIL